MGGLVRFRTGGFLWKREGGFLEVAMRNKVDTHPTSWPSGTRGIKVNIAGSGES